MQLEFHQLDRRWEHLRVREPHRQRRLLASLADSGQQTPIVVVAAGSPDCYLVIDGHKRVAALEQLGRDTVEATVWAMSEAEALLPSRSLRFGPPESALEQGWLLAEMEQRFGYGLEDLARLFDRSRGGDFRRGVSRIRTAAGDPHRQRRALRQPRAGRAPTRTSGWNHRRQILHGFFRTFGIVMFHRGHHAATGQFRMPGSLLGSIAGSVLESAEASASAGGGTVHQYRPSELGGIRRSDMRPMG
jgi:hypothetical protein